LQAVVEEQQTAVRHAEASVSQLKDQTRRAESSNMNQVQTMQDSLEQTQQVFDEANAQTEAAQLAAKKLAAEHEASEAKESAAEKAYNFEKRAEAMKQAEGEVQRAEQKARDSRATVDKWRSDLQAAETHQEMQKVEEQTQLVIAQRKLDSASGQLKSAESKLNAAQNQVSDAQQGASKALTEQEVANKEAKDAAEEAGEAMPKRRKQRLSRRRQSQECQIQAMGPKSPGSTQSKKKFTRSCTSWQQS